MQSGAVGQQCDATGASTTILDDHHSPGLTPIVRRAPGVFLSPPPATGCSDDRRKMGQYFASNANGDLTPIFGDSSMSGTPVPLASSQSFTCHSKQQQQSAKAMSRTSQLTLSRRLKSTVIVVAGLLIILLVSGMFHGCRLLGAKGFGRDQLKPSEPESVSAPSSITIRGQYRHPRWRPRGSFVDATPIYESDWVSIEEHSVHLDETSQFALSGDGGINSKHVVHKWLWVNQPDQINVLVHLGHSRELQRVLLSEPKERSWNQSYTDEIDKRLSTYKALLNVPVLDSPARSTFPTFKQWLQPGRNTDEPLARRPKRENVFLMFRQRKYGFEGLSLSVVGGAVDVQDGGSSVAAAQRELREELGLERCDVLTTGMATTRKFGLVHLGGYRTDTNRGGGTVFSFVASRCPLSPNASFITPAQTSKISKKSLREPHKMVMQSSDGDLESQPVVIVTEQHLLESALFSQSETVSGMQGSVKEIKWMGTTAMALLRMAHLNL